MDELSRFVELLEQGGVLACPTETWLGLLADARNDDAVRAVAELKGRPAEMPIALLLPNAEALAEVAFAPSAAVRVLMEAHWPGPLTILLAAKPHLNPRLIKDGKVGVRIPGPSLAAELSRAFGHPLTATSANLSGEPPIRSVDELPASIVAGLGGMLPGLSPGGPPSTLVDATSSPMRVLRQGAVEIDMTAL